MKRLFYFICFSLVLFDCSSQNNSIKNKIINPLISDTTIQINALGPTFNFENSKITFAANLEKNNWHIYTYDLNTSELSKLTNGYHEVNPIWYNENNFILYSKYTNEKINDHSIFYLYDPKSNESTLFFDEFKEINQEHPLISCDNKVMAWFSSNIMLTDLTNRQTVQLTNEKETKLIPCDFSSDLNKILIVSSLNGNTEIFELDIKSKKLNRIVQASLKAGSGYIDYARYSIDNQSIYFSNCNKFFELKVIGKKEKVLFELTSYKYIGKFDLSADGRYVLFADVFETHDGPIHIRKIND